MLAEVQSYLAAQLDPAIFPSVEVAEELDALSERAGLVRSGAVIVMPWRERASVSPFATGGHRQLVAVEIVVGLVIRNYDKLGQARALAFDTLKSRLEQALAGWVAPSANSPMMLVGGESSPVVKGVSIYVQTWSTSRYLTGVAA